MVIWISVTQKRMKFELNWDSNAINWWCKEVLKFYQTFNQAISFLLWNNWEEFGQKCALQLIFEPIFTFRNRHSNYLKNEHRVTTFLASKTYCPPFFFKGVYYQYLAFRMKTFDYFWPYLLLKTACVSVWLSL